VRFLCQQAKPYAGQLTPALSDALSISRGMVVLRAAAALAQLDPQIDRLDEASATIAGQLAGAEKEVIDWAQLLMPVKGKIHDDLKEILRTSASAQQMVGSAEAFGFLFADRVDELCELLFVARDLQFMTLIEALRPKREQAIAILLSSVPTFDSLRPSLQTPEQDVMKAASRVLALTALGDGEDAWPLWSVAADPRLQTYLIHGYYSKKLSPDELARKVRLLSDSQAAIQYGLLLSLGGYESTDLAENERNKLMQWLIEKYQSHPDSGVHSAILWLLKQWNKDQQLGSIDSDIIKQGMRPGFTWCLNSFGQTMILVRPRPGERIANMIAGDTKQPELVVYPFMIAATETMWKEYLTLFPSKKQHADVTSDEEPVRGLSWFDAAEFCRKLSERENLGLHCDAIIVTNRPPQEIATVDLTQSGYRPPTEPEWEYAVRCGTITDRFFGRPETEFVKEYIWQSMYDNKTVEVARLRPNQAGLFNGYGNVHEWTVTPSRPNEFTHGLTKFVVSPEITMIFRGGAWDTVLTAFTSSNRNGRSPSRTHPSNLFLPFGLRVARQFSQ